MEKLQILLLIIIALNLVSCQEDELKELQNKKVMHYFDNPEYFEKQFKDSKKSEFFSFYKGVYEFATTKDLSLKFKETQEELFPWDIKISKSNANDVLNNIVGSIYATVDDNSDSKKTFSEIVMLSPYVLELSERESEDFKDGWLPKTKNILANINYEYISYDLKNEEGMSVNIIQEYVGICNGGIHGKEDVYYHGFCMMNQSLKPDFKKLKGYVNLKIQVPYDYEIQIITKADVGKNITIGKNKIKIFEFDGNVIHYQILEKGGEFETEDNGGSSSSLILPLDFYKKLRADPGLSFEEAWGKKDYFEIDKVSSEYKEEIFITHFDDYSIDSFYFYIPKYVSRNVKILVDIN